MHLLILLDVILIVRLAVIHDQVMIVKYCSTTLT